MFRFLDNWIKRPKIGIALGGGGARGLAHVGVLKVLEKNDIPIDFIAGTSIGALIGSAYALRPNARLLHARMARFLESKEFHESGLSRFRRKEAAENFFGQVAKYVRERIVINLAHSRLSVVGAERLNRVIEVVLDDRLIEDSKIPLAIVATDLNTGEEVIFREGSVRHATVASASIPGFLPPVAYNGRILVDGAVTAPIPVQAAFAMGADIVIGVDVGQNLMTTVETQNIVDIIFRSSTITANRLRYHITRHADIAIFPEVGSVHWADFEQYENLVAAGEKACLQALPDIRAHIHSRQPFLRRIIEPAPKRDESAAHGAIQHASPGDALASSHASPPR
ncbi:MAG TPA: patatin-like phospholipase family protein [Bacteroidetes bacterium]|nr:patatin-like phospholipase family protein [Bacteroidota bacterium]